VAITTLVSGSKMNPERIVLVVDDEELLRSYLAFELGKMGLKAVEAGTGREGLAKTRTQKFDLIITDLRMPDMNGDEFLCSMHGETGMLPPVIIITGAALGADVHKIRINIAATLMKPFFPAEIKAAVEQALANKISSASA
jgi:two-component system response regulator AtoC